MDAPVSRVRAVYLANPEQPVHAAHVDAVASCGTQPFYDWHELSRTNGDYGSHLFAGGSPDINVYRDMIPDGDQFVFQRGLTLLKTRVDVASQFSQV